MYIKPIIHINMVSALPRNKAIEEALPVGTKLTPEEISRIQGLIEAGMYISVSDFVREAIMDKLRDIKDIKVRDVNYDVATREVLDYYRTYKEAYPHEVADALELDYDLVWKITEESKRDMRLEVID